MKKKTVMLIIAGILFAGGISTAYAAGRNSLNFNNLSRSMMGINNSNVISSNNYGRIMMGAQTGGAQWNNNYSNMIKIMRDNGFNDEANAMINGDFNAMNSLMANLSGKDYQDMINIMKNNGYSSMAGMMQSIGNKGIEKFHKGMMGNY